MLQKSSMAKTKEIFFKHPQKDHYLMDISRTLKIAHTSIKINLKKLLRTGFITKHIEIKGSRKFPLYKANIENFSFIQEKKQYNIQRIYESKLMEFLENKLMPKVIVLFGSYQRAEDTNESDIDLFVECKDQNINLKKFEKKLQRKIQLHFKEKFCEYPIELKNNIINGVVLQGFLVGYK